MPPSCDFISEIDKKYNERKINQYKDQDIKTNCSSSYYITVNEIEQLLLKYNHRCVYCWDPVNKDNLTVDRINNNLGHIHKNCVIACKNCNSERGADDKECTDKIAIMKNVKKKIKNNMFVIIMNFMKKVWKNFINIIHHKYSLSMKLTKIFFMNYIIVLLVGLVLCFIDIMRHTNIYSKSLF